MIAAIERWWHRRSCVLCSDPDLGAAAPTFAVGYLRGWSSRIEDATTTAVDIFRAISEPRR